MTGDREWIPRADAPRIAQQLRERCRALGLTQVELAGRANLAKSTLVHWERHCQKERRMLRVTIELLPGGRECGKRVIATADIARVREGSFGALANYGVALEDTVLGEVGDRAIVRSYPRWATSVWDLVARCLAAALNQDTEALPPRPVQPEVTVHTNGAGSRYVRLDEIPEPAKTFFDQKLAGSAVPDHGCAYAHDWFDFLNAQR